MGIINTTPDSFYAESRQQSVDGVLYTTEQMLTDGAVILDLGGYSTRPGAAEVSMEEELQRTIPFIEAIVKRFPEAILSIDTFRSGVAQRAVEAGAAMVNDVSSGDDDEAMIETIAALQVPYIIMHKKGTPQTMQHNPEYENVVLEVMDYFVKKIALLKALNIKDLVIDPGFGFGKTMTHNYQLMKALGDFQIFGLPVLAGVSRKKMIQHITGTDAAHALNGTSVLHTVALMQGAKILRAHDVKEASECIKLVNAVYGTV